MKDKKLTGYLLNGDKKVVWVPSYIFFVFSDKIPLNDNMYKLKPSELYTKEDCEQSKADMVIVNLLSKLNCFNTISNI